MILSEQDRATIESIVSQFGLDVDRIDDSGTAEGAASVKIIVDGDKPVGLDELAEVSNALDGPSQGWGSPERKVVLEVSSRGVGAPLETATHFRRARGRKAEIAFASTDALSDVIGGKGSKHKARIGDVDEVEGRVWLVFKAGKSLHAQWVGLGDIERAVVQVEFSSPPQDEIDRLVADS